MDLKIDEIEDIYKTLKNDFTNLREKQRKWLSYVDGTYLTGLEGTETVKSVYDHIVKPPRGIATIEGGTNYLALDKVRVIQAPRMRNDKVTESAKALANNIEKFCQNHLDAWADIPPYYVRDNIKDILSIGEGWYHVTMAPEIFEEAKGFTGLPFRIEAPDPLSILAPLLTDDYGCPSIVFRETVIYAYELWEIVSNFPFVSRKHIGEYPRVLKDKAKAKDKILLLEWWTKKNRGYLVGVDKITEDVDFEVVPYQGTDIFDNIYGFVPYTHGFSGIGRFRGNQKPEDGIKAILAGAEDIIVQEARDATRMDAVAAHLTFVTEKWTILDDEEIVAKDFIHRPGEPILETATRKHQWGPQLTIPPALLQHQQINRDYLDWYLPPITRGITNPSETATSTSNKFNWSMQQWEGARTARNHMIVNSLIMCLRMIEATGQTVEFGGIKLTPEDIKGHYALRVNISSGNPEEQRIKRAQGVALYKYFPRDVIVQEYFDEPDSKRFLEEKYADDLFELILLNPNNPVFLPIMNLVAQGFQLRLEQEGLIKTSEGLKPLSPAPEAGAGLGGSPPLGILPVPNAQPPPVEGEGQPQALENVNPGVL